MKNSTIILLVAGFALLFLSCEKNDNMLSGNEEEFLIEQIASATKVVPVSVKGLPSAISRYIVKNHETEQIEMAFHALSYGYEVFLGNGLCLYFNENDNHLNHDGMHGDMGNHHGGGDSDMNYCMAGDTLDIANIPQAIADYITTNHSGSSIDVFVVKPSGMFAVEISRGDILMFSMEGRFIHFCEIQDTGGHGHKHGDMGNPGWHCGLDGQTGGGHGGSKEHGNHGGMDNHSGSNESCWGGTSITIEDLPIAIITYIDANHQDATIVHVMNTFNNNYFLRLSDCARVVFDEDGNVLFDSGN